MTEDAERLRQWVSLPQSASCDVRLGAGEVERVGSTLRGAAAPMGDCLLICDDAAGDGLQERVRRQLTDAGYRVSAASVAHEGCRTLEELGRIAKAAIEAHVTSDDLVCAVGGADALSLASALCGRLFGKTPLCAIPTDVAALAECVVTPRGIDVAGSAEALVLAPAARTVIFDTDVAQMDGGSEPALLARALMVSTAMCDGERAFSTLWDRAGAIADGDSEVLLSQLMDTLKSRGHLASSSSIATRQSVYYGRTFARALAPLTEAAPSTLLAEALRFQARVAAGEGKLAVDDVLAQDELLETLGLPQLSCTVDPEEMVAAIRAERFRTSKRFLLGLPQALGRVRLSSVDEALLLEHARAWCQTRAPEGAASQQS